MGAGLQEMPTLWLLLIITILKSVLYPQVTFQKYLSNRLHSRYEPNGDKSYDSAELMMIPEESEYGQILIKRGDESHYGERLMKRGIDFDKIAKFMKRLMKRGDESEYQARLMKRGDESEYQARLMKREDESE